LTLAAQRAAPPPASLLLGRAEFAGDINGATQFVSQRRVLVTGAGGSIGSPLSSALQAAGPAHLTLVDHHEHSLFSLERSLGAPNAQRSYELVDIRDADRMRRIFATHRPDVVFHLAAAKHVPYGERFPEGAVATNVLALQQLLHASRESDVETFVYPSSDKSVQPPSVYGATKRLAEGLIQQITHEHGLRWAILRYVNIIGTRGSVIETFTQQVLNDAPLSVTDDRMTRYWISMDEAVWSIVNTGGCGAAGEIVMPDSGEPVPVIETASRLAGWYRPERVPYPINRTGIRPGERLHEVLLSPNERFSDAAGPAPGLLHVDTRRDPATLDQVPAQVRQLQALVDRGDREAVRHACLAAADALQ
jgi:FlaA1/EpsC-like NDP-sugar epimerase